jgi:hypothetical protein
MWKTTDVMRYVWHNTIARRVCFVCTLRRSKPISNQGSIITFTANDILCIFSIDLQGWLCREIFFLPEQKNS